MGAAGHKKPDNTLENNEFKKKGQNKEGQTTMCMGKEADDEEDDEEKDAEEEEDAAAEEG